MSWEQLLAIARDAAAEAQAAASQPPVACENDGEPLKEAKGGRHCTFCGRIY